MANSQNRAVKVVGKAEIQVVGSSVVSLLFLDKRVFVSLQTSVGSVTA